jgi:putative ATPase
MTRSHNANSPDLFGWYRDQTHQPPLPEALRPKSLEDYLGQEEILAEGKPLRNLILSKRLASLLFWGPPGVGKTTLARILAQHSNAAFIELSAVHSGLKELREAIAQAETTQKNYGQETVIFIDEIHRYSKTQQDALLPYVEKGTIVLIGATTENPSFQVIPALLSRMLLVRLTHLGREAIRQLVLRGVKHFNNLHITAEAVEFIADYANGDGRSALALLDIAEKCALVKEDQRYIKVSLLEELAQQARLNYDRQGDEHYDHASAYQKSMRGGDADAALYWLGKMIAAGEDPRFIARRLMVTASEDVGLADPMALLLATSAAEAVERLGLPEGRIPLAQATIYVARAPKNNQAICAIDQVLSDIRTGGKSYPVPTHLRDSHYSGAKNYGHGVGYVYSHDHPDQPQTFLPDELVGTRYLPEP